MKPERARLVWWQYDKCPVVMRHHSSGFWFRVAINVGVVLFVGAMIGRFLTWGGM